MIRRRNLRRRRRRRGLVTGVGEAFIKAAAAKQAVEALRAGRSPSEAARELLPLVRRHGGSGGLIRVDTAGRVGLAFDTPRMAHA